MGGHKRNLKFTGDPPVCAVEDPLCSIASRAGMWWGLQGLCPEPLMFTYFLLTVRAVEPRRIGRAS